MSVDVTFRGRRVLRDRALVMAIVNRTPDSFFDKGATYTDDAAHEAVRAAIAAGADIIDVGGVKAGPGSVVDVDEEIRRTVPFLAAVRAEFPDTILSIDTWRAEVGRQCALAGADVINDTWAGADPGLADVAAEHALGFVCSHTGGAVPRTRPHRVHYDDVVRDVVDQTTAAAEALVARGVPRGGILIDPTHDFGKNTWHGLELLRRAGELVDTGWPVLMALSNKDFIGETLGRPVDQRREGTFAATAIAAMAGAAIFRAHDVAGTLRVLEMTASIRGDRTPTRVVRGLV
ncbi:dihydropteroate synthase [Aeromicrobium stalagmiti]|uniref:dihydropteroate synthase n=1 Tax=Aeromicrobium stalagmiti TaxID=2738988 RepID=UPI001569B8F8|nr:dihydropteroate synthase [Aeromicrobium stalagmiti]NRQ51176.1 dihydropteroate synthase [Aeromicrobium stalagmiti]